jgi:NADPH-dependent 2,4-dienoyl-CoA reductase/sulfur reductase-like enzyme
VHQVDVAIVGAGPAGLAAALTLREHGGSVLLVDEQSRPGGQIYRQPPAGFEVAHWLEGRAYAPGRELLAAAGGLEGVDWRASTTAWGVFGLQAGLDSFARPEAPEEGLVLGLSGPTGIEYVRPTRLLIAPGAYDLPVAFPGWTLPGVMAAGGVQAFVKSQKLLPGRRFVLAGGHPLLLVVADQLLAAGADLAAVAFAQPRPGVTEALRTLPRLGRHVVRLADAAGPAARLRRARVPLLVSHVVAHADGGEQLERVTLAAVDDEWRPRVGREQTFDCDTLAVGYGFVPSSELARQAGCAYRFDGPAGGFVVECDAWMRSSLDAVYVAGEVVGIAGANQAIEEGRLAALGILGDLGRLQGDTLARLRRAARRRLDALAPFSAIVRERFAPRYDALARLADDDTIVCRCEEITAGELRAALRENPHLGTADAVKLFTRTGMGPCQGRFCMLTVAHMIADARGAPVGVVGPYASRPPVKPVGIAALADAQPS